MNMTDNIVRGQTSPLAGRVGTVWGTRAQLCALLGAPSYDDPGAEKVTVRWYFNTPRGPAEVRDYWWNSQGEWSIAARSDKARLWLSRYLRRLGLRVARGMPR